MNKDLQKDLELAIAIHGHLAPGIVLGVRMGRHAFELLGAEKRGKGLTGVVETKVCLPDALMAVAGTTPGNGNLIIFDLGKLAISLARYPSGEGYRVALRSEATSVDDTLEKFMYRRGKLTWEEMDTVREIFQKMDESYFRVEKVKLALPLPPERLPITRCSICGELQPESFMHNGICLICAGKGYFESVPEEIESKQKEEVMK